MTGPLALVGGGEWQDGCSFDRALLEASGAAEVVVLPTAGAYEHPERLVEQASTWFASLGAKVNGLGVLNRRDAQDADHAAVVAGARFVYLAGGSALHLRSVLKESAVWEALVQAFSDGAVVAGTSAGAMVMCDPMVDPRGGAFTLGLGLVEQVAVIPHFDAWSPEKHQRALQLAPAGVPIVGVDEQTALIRHADGRWEAAGAGKVEVFVDGKKQDLAALPT
jgi:cyanophycinase